MTARFIALPFALVGLLSFCLPALGFPGGGKRDHHGHHDRGDHFERQVSDLALADETRAQIDALFAAADEQRDALRAQMHDAHEALRTQLEEDLPDLEQVLAQVDVLGSLQTQAHKLQLETMLGVRALLTPEQREQLREARRERSERWREHKQDSERF